EMHGIIFSELKKMAEAAFGPDGWGDLLRDAGLKSSIYMPVGDYPDADAVAIVGAAARKAGKDVKTILEDFGEFIVPELVRLYKPMIKPEWDILEFLENTEETIHRAVRTKDGARPPALSVARTGGDQVVVTYSSARQLCGIAIGIIRGLSKHYSEPV